MDTTSQAQVAQDREARRERMLAKIAALRAKTAAAGASEHEAMSAAEKAAELMEAHGITEDDLGAMRGKAFEWARGMAGMANGTVDHKVSFCAVWIARLTGTRCIFSKRGFEGKWQRVAEYFGEGPDVELATWLHSTIREALDREYKLYRKGMGRVGQGAKSAFQAGMVRRLNERMREIIEAREVARTDTTRALVVCKRELVTAAWREIYPRIYKGRSRMSWNPHQSAFGAGAQAGDKVGLGRPVGDQGTARTLCLGFKG